MDFEGSNIINLEGPFNYHLYIGFAPANETTANDLHKILKERVKCYLRATNDGVQSSIQEGVRRSQKCLLFLTPDYLKDDWYQIETVAVEEKSEQICRDMVIILKSEELQEEVPERLREFTTIQFKREKLNDKIFLAQFVEVIIREPNVKLAVLPKQNIGYGLAFGYFYGFLRLTLPGFKKRLIEETLKNDPDLVPKTIQKMLIIMPESCFCAVQIESPNQIEFTKKFVVRVAHRAGNKQRDYKSSLYKLTDHENEQEFYFVGELATPLLTMYDTFSSNLCGLTKDQMYAERNAFYFTLKAILSHPDNSECNDQFKLLFWSDPEPEKPNQLDLYSFLLHMLRKEHSLQQQNERNPSETETTSNIRLMSPNPKLPSTFEIVEVGGYNPARIYEELRKYPMEHRPRGFCLIVNIENFQNHVQLKRNGAEKDAELLKKLFENLHFKVEVHNDVNAETLEKLFLKMHQADHTDYDAFVCCILTHGKLGVIYTSDGKAFEILRLVEFFTDRNCPSLKGKPKMFFIQACQKGYQEGISGIDIRVVEQPFMEVARPGPILSILDETQPAAIKHKAVLVPGHPDFLMSYSTLPGSISYRDTQMGSLYIQALDECLRKDMEIDRALKTVSAIVKEELRLRRERDVMEYDFQLPFHLTSGMDRLIYL